MPRAGPTMADHTWSPFFQKFNSRFTQNFTFLTSHIDHRKMYTLISHFSQNLISKNLWSEILVSHVTFSKWEPWIEREPWIFFWKNGLLSEEIVQLADCNTKMRRSKRRRKNSLSSMDSGDSGNASTFEVRMSSTASSTKHYIFDYFGPNIRLFDWVWLSWTTNSTS